ncbi:MAG: branched-chain amino acid ABC transporter substrate-binding protein [Anaerolineae bacterium]
MNKTVRLGHSTPLSGEEGVHGTAANHAVELAVRQANERGNLPFQIELVSLDDACTAEGGEAVARQLSADPAVLGVVGPFNSTPAQAAAPIYYQARLPHICPAASNPDLTRQGWDTFFRVVASDEIQGREAARCAVRFVGARRIAVLHDRSAFGQPLAEIFADEARMHGAEIVLVEGIHRGQRHFPDTVQRVRDADPDLIYFGLIEAEGSAMAHELRAGGVLAPYLGADGLKPSRYLETPEVEVAGPYYTSASADVRRYPSAADFRRAYARDFPQFADYTIYTVEAYDAANILIEALRKAGAADREAVRQQVARTRNYPGASGPITFSPTGDRLNPRIDFYVVRSGELVFLGTTADLVGSNRDR